MEHIPNNHSPKPSAPEHSDASTPATPTPPPSTGDTFWRELIQFGLIALLIVLPIRIFIAQPFIVSGASMEHTFQNGQYLIVDQLTYRLADPERGDIVIFKYPNDRSKYFIKRVIGIPGDTLYIEGSRVAITDSTGNETILDEPYVEMMHQDTPITQTLSKDEYFVLGDNRDASSDSRIWGVLTRDDIVGRAYVRLFPISEVDFLPGKYNINHLQQ